MNKRIITSISLLVAGVVTGVTVCAIALTGLEWQKASKVSQQTSLLKLASAANERVDRAKTSKKSQKNFGKNLHLAQGSSAKTTPEPNSSVALDPVSRTVQPNILHHAAMNSVAGQGQYNGTTTIPVVDGQPLPTVTTTTYIIQQPAQEFTVTSAGAVQEVGASRAVDTPDAMVMPIGRNGLQQNPCVDPPSTFGKAYNRGM